MKAMGAQTAFGPDRWARLATALVNTSPGQRHGDALTGRDDLRALLVAHQEPEPVTIDDRDLADARQARAELAAVFAAQDPAELAERLNQLLARTARPQLTAHDGVPLHLHLDPPGSSWGEWLAATGAMALALLVAEHGTSVLGHCAGPGCHHALIRLGRGPARRYCDSRCAARRRVADHRARTRAT
jgi:predicted RNA-binding Zn ribbon-like protein